MSTFRRRPARVIGVDWQHAREDVPQDDLALRRPQPRRRVRCALRQPRLQLGREVGEESGATLGPCLRGCRSSRSAARKRVSRCWVRAPGPHRRRVASRASSSGNTSYTPKVEGPNWMANHAMVPGSSMTIDRAWVRNSASSFSLPGSASDARGELGQHGSDSLAVGAPPQPVGRAWSLPLSLVSRHASQGRRSLASRKRVFLTAGSAWVSLGAVVLAGLAPSEPRRFRGRRHAADSQVFTHR